MQMQSGSRLERARAGVGAFGLFRELSADDKRELAVLVAQRVAPELVPRIQAEGTIDLTEDQSRAVLDMVRRLDADDLVELQDAVATPESRRQALQSVGGAAAAATGLDDVVADPPAKAGSPPPSAASTNTGAMPRPGADDSSEQLRARVRILDERVDELTEELAEARHAQSESEAAIRAARAEAQDAVSRAQAAEHRADERDRAAERARRNAEDAAERVREVEARLRRARSGVDDGFFGTPDRDVSDPGPAEHGMPTHRSTSTIETRLRSLPPSGALRLVTRTVPGLAERSPDDRLRIVMAIPDGWARRRAIQRLTEGGAVTAMEAPGLVATLSSAGNQVFAARTMLDHGVADLAALAPALDSPARERLARSLWLP